MFKLKFRKLHQEFFQVLHRFPLAILSSLFLTVYVINLSSWPESWHKEALISIFAINILWFISIKLIAESQKWRKVYEISLALSVFGLISHYLYTLFPLLPPSLLMAFGFIALISVAPFMGKNLNKENMWSYHYQLGIQAIFALFVSFVICSGIGLILKSLDYLFHVILVYDQYEKLIKATVCFLLPIIFMMGIPSRFNEPEENTQRKNVQLLLNYALAPIWLMFSLILIVYAIKIFSMQDLPRGKVTFLVAWLGTLGSFTFLLGDTTKMPLSVAHKFFRKHFFHLLIIPLVLMGVGIGVRIHQYGLTMGRYFVCLIFISLLLFTMYSFVVNRAKITRFMLMCTACLFLVGSFGPWGIVELSSLSQFKRLQYLLEKNHILENNKIQKDHPPVDSKEEIQISNLVNYLTQHGNPKLLKKWFASEDQKLFDIPNHTILNGKELTLRMGIKYALVPQLTLTNDTFAFKHQENKSKWVHLKEQDYLLKNFSINTQSFSEVEETLPGSPKIVIKIKFDKQRQKLTFKIKNRSEPSLIIDFTDIIPKLKEEQGSSVIDKNIVFEGNADSLYLKFIIQKISGVIEKRGDAKVENIKVANITGDLFIGPVS